MDERLYLSSHHTKDYWLCILSGCNYEHLKIQYWMNPSCEWNKDKAHLLLLHEHIQISEHHVVTIFQFHGLTFGTFTAFFFQLQRIHVPVSNLVETNFVVNMMFTLTWHKCGPVLMCWKHKCHCLPTCLPSRYL